MNEFIGGKVSAQLEHLANWAVHQISWNHAIYVASPGDRQALLREANKVIRNIGYWRREPTALGSVSGYTYHMNDNMSQISVYQSLSGEIVVSHRWHGVEQRNDDIQTQKLETKRGDGGGAWLKRPILVYMTFKSFFQRDKHEILVSGPLFFWFDFDNYYKRIARVKPLIQSVEEEMEQERGRAGAPFNERRLVQLDQRLEALTPFRPEDLVAYELDERKWLVGAVKVVNAPLSQEAMIFDSGTDFWNILAGHTDYRRCLLEGEAFLERYKEQERKRLYDGDGR